MAQWRSFLRTSILLVSVHPRSWPKESKFWEREWSVRFVFSHSSPLLLSFFLFHFTIPLLKKLTTFYFVRKFFGKTSRIVRLDGRGVGGGGGKIFMGIFGSFHDFRDFFIFGLLDWIVLTLVWSLQSGQGGGKKVFLTVKTARNP